MCIQLQKYTHAHMTQSAMSTCLVSFPLCRQHLCHHWVLCKWTGHVVLKRTTRGKVNISKWGHCARLIAWEAGRGRKRWGPLPSTITTTQRACILCERADTYTRTQTYNRSPSLSAVPLTLCITKPHLTTHWEHGNQAGRDKEVGDAKRAQEAKGASAWVEHPRSRLSNTRETASNVRSNDRTCLPTYKLSESRSTPDCKIGPLYFTPKHVCNFYNQNLPINACKTRGK